MEPNLSPSDSSDSQIASLKEAADCLGEPPALSCYTPVVDGWETTKLSIDELLERKVSKNDSSEKD